MKYTTSALYLELSALLFLFTKKFSSLVPYVFFFFFLRCMNAFYFFKDRLTLNRDAPNQYLHVCVYAFLHVEPLGHVKFPSLLCRESRRMSKSGHCSIVNNDLQFVNSGTHFSKCQAYFSTIVSGLFSHRAPDEDKVTSLW